MNATDRRNDIARRVIAGETLQSIADDYGISRQRVHQLAPKDLHTRTCGHCGRPTKSRQQVYCDDCHSCSKCGKRFSAGNKHDTNLLCQQCKAKTRGRMTTRAVEVGICKRYWPDMDYWGPTYYVLADNPQRWHTFDTLEEAREFRRSRGLPVGFPVGSYPKRNCKSCGMLFKPKMPWQRFHDEACRKQYAYRHRDV